MISIIPITFLSACAVGSPNPAPSFAVKAAALKDNHEVWQLTSIDEIFWSDKNYSFDVRASIIEQTRLVTWSFEGEIEKSALWLDCNVPKLEIRRRIMVPARSIEKPDGSGYEAIPAEYNPYLEIVRTSEGCSFMPPAKFQANPDDVRDSLNAIFEKSLRKRDGAHLTYFDAQGLVVAKFESGRPLN